MKTLTTDGLTVALDGDELTVITGGDRCTLSRAALGRMLAELDARRESSPPPGTDHTDWVPLTHGRIGHNRVCRYRAGVARGDAVEWGPWSEGFLAVEVRDYDVPRSHRDQTRFWRAGEPATVGISGRSDLAEYPPDELGGDGVFAADGGDRQFLLQVQVPA